MEFVPLVRQYFENQKATTLWLVIPSGILLLIAAIIAIKIYGLKENLGLTLPLFIISIIFISSGISLYFKIKKQENEIVKNYHLDEENTINEEFDRVSNLKNTVKSSIFVYLILILIAPIVYYLFNYNWIRGICIGILLFNTFGLLIDGGFVINRVKVYQNGLRQLKQEAVHLKK